MLLNTMDEQKKLEDLEDVEFDRIAEAQIAARNQEQLDYKENLACIAATKTQDIGKFAIIGKSLKRNINIQLKSVH